MNDRQIETKKSIDDDCPTEEEQIRISRKDLERELKEGVAAVKDAMMGGGNIEEDTLANAKYNPGLKMRTGSIAK